MRPSQRDDSTVCLIIVTANSAATLPRCLEAVATQSRLPDEVILIDNASSDGSADVAERLVARLPALVGRVTVRRETHNLGFAAANNRGISETAAEFIALLNPDAFPAPRWIESLLAAARMHPEAAAFGSLQMMEGRPGIVDGCGDVYHVSGISWRSGHGRALRPADLLEREIFSPCAAAALYRRSAVVAAGMFDEDFFCYIEDVDLGFRLRLAGHTARHVPAAVVEHVGSASSGSQRSRFAVYHGHRNIVWCFLKNMPQPLFAGLLIPHFAQSIVSWIVTFWRGQGLVFLSAKRDALGQFRAVMQKRREVQRPPLRQVSWWRIWQALDAGWWRS